MGNDTMAFTKLVKNSAYFSRYQVKYKRRRSGKTDYAARKKLISQAKNKYNAPKHRLVVRFTNKDIICQIVSSELNGDRVVAAAYAHESRRPFKAFLDVGLVRTSTGARVFGAMKGASDGGLLIPHSESRFPGYDIEAKELDAETLRKYIFGGHVAEYMETLADDDEELYKTLFNGYIEDGIEADGLEELYADAHKQIREDPFKKDDDEGEKKSKDYWKEESKKYKKGKLTSEQRRERVKARIEELKEEMA